MKKLISIEKSSIDSKGYWLSENRPDAYELFVLIYFNPSKPRKFRGTRSRMIFSKMFSGENTYFGFTVGFI